MRPAQHRFHSNSLAGASFRARHFHYAARRYARSSFPIPYSLPLCYNRPAVERAAKQEPAQVRSAPAQAGRIVLGEESNALREKVKSLIAEGKKKIVLNMDNITFIDSAGLGTLVAAHHSVKTQGASMRLCHLGSKFQEVLQITKLLTVFDVYNTEAEAVASFSKTAGA